MAYIAPNHEVAPIIKASTVSYIGSYMARARYLDLQEVKNGLRTMMNWALAYITDKSSTKLVNKKLTKRYNPYASSPSSKHSDSPNTKSSSIIAKDHTLFYTTIQSILYLFCFRWKELLTDADDNLKHGAFPVELSGLERIIHSKYQPLKVNQYKFSINNNNRCVHQP